MQIPNNTVVAVADGEKLHMFLNSGDERDLKLVALDDVDIDAASTGSASAGRNSSANPDGGQAEEAGFAVGIAEMLNRRVLSRKVTSLVVIAAPRTLGELRKHYHKSLEAILIGELPKDLTGHSLHDIEKALATLES
jgi:protein required for attachment to host cells